MAFTLVQRRAAQGHALVDGAIITDVRRLTDHHTHAVVDKNSPAHDRAGMNFDTGEEARELRNPAAGPFEIGQPEPMCKPMPSKRMHAGIQRQNFERRACGGIAFQHHRDIFPQSSKHP